MKRLILFLMIAVTLTGCNESKKILSDPSEPQQSSPSPPEAAETEQQQDPLSINIEGMKAKLSEIQIKRKSTEDLLIKRTAERDTAKSEFGLLIRRSDKNPLEIKAELAKANSELDSQLWFHEIKAAWNKLVDLERDVVIFTRQEARLDKSKIQLEQSLEKLKRIEENNKVYIKGEDPELDQLIAEGDITIQEKKWEEMSTGEKNEIVLEVDRIMTETFENNDSKIPGLELEYLEKLTQLPGIAEKVQEPETTVQKSLLARIKNDCNKIVERDAENFAEYLKNNQFETACRSRLETIQEVQKKVTLALDSFPKGFFKVYLDELATNRNDTLLVMSKPYLLTLSQCVQNLESEEPDWKSIAESLEGLLQIRPTFSDLELETQLPIIRTHFEYSLKQDERDAQIMQARLKPVLEEMEKYCATRHYEQAVAFYNKEQYPEALTEIKVALDLCPENCEYLEQKKAIEEDSIPGARKVYSVDGIEYAFRWCPPGEFMMGSTDGNGNEEPVHKVKLTKGFWILETEVTQAMWQSVTGRSQWVQDQLAGCGEVYPGSGSGPQYPVYRVSWEECQEFCQILSQKLGKQVRLPTEAQWEYACRAGTTDDYAGDLGSMAWYRDNSGGTTHAVGKKKPNAWGLYDMQGNVQEWCSDYYDRKYYDRSPTSDPENTTASSYHVSRGGSWSNDGRSCRSAERDMNTPDFRNWSQGFRVLLVPSQD